MPRKRRGVKGTLHVDPNEEIAVDVAAMYKPSSGLAKLTHTAFQSERRRQFISPAVPTPVSVTETAPVESKEDKDSEGCPQVHLALVP